MVSFRIEMRWFMKTFTPVWETQCKISIFEEKIEQSRSHWFEQNSKLCLEVAVKALKKQYTLIQFRKWGENQWLSCSFVKIPSAFKYEKYILKMPN